MAAVRFLLFLSFSTLALSLSENEALIKFKSSLVPQSPGALDTWVPNTNPCQWTGISCANGAVSGIRLEEMGLTGTIDVDALLDLPTLRIVTLQNNSFSGPIPGFNKLGALKALYLSSNQFSGEIPSDYFSQMGSLKKLWLADNKFTGNIPESIMKLPNLMELHLEGNQFSGPIPPLDDPSLTSLDLANNKLTGEIPESFSKFDPKLFAGNDGLCGKLVDKDCKDVEGANQEKSSSDETHSDDQGSSSSSSSGDGDNGNKHSQMVIISISVAGFILIAVLIYLFFVRHKDRHEDFNVLEKEHLNDVKEIQVQEVAAQPRKSTTGGSTTRKRGMGKKGSTNGRKGIGDLVVVNDEKGSFGLPDLMKAAAEVLGNSGLGSAYKAVLATGLSVVVKRLRDANRLDKDGFEAEMRRLGALKHPNILTPLAYHYRKEEKLIISEYVPKGSLLYVLHGDRGTTHAELNWPNRLKIVQGIARGLGFLHKEHASLELPHGNLKSSNVLLSKDYDPLISDYAFHPLLNPDTVAASMFAYKLPEYIQNQQVSHKSDVYCLGIIILEVLTGKFPSQYVSNGKGGTDIIDWVHSSMAEGKETELIDPMIANKAESLNSMVQLIKIGVACTESNPEQRPDMEEAIRRIEEVQA